MKSGTSSVQRFLSLRNMARTCNVDFCLTRGVGTQQARRNRVTETAIAMTFCPFDPFILSSLIGRPLFYDLSRPSCCTSSLDLYLHSALSAVNLTCWK
ncbi:hypothetical protein MPTK1_6g11510 [Marchantia polymorpha subsp. ruderalis]|uniref:Uncharacterized protein n=2 Tax=Marchantia polymorpha TaxID=3197 RepID=A0AAF6BQY3_MARPO|nr:hypothetical protein MARPO_0016s0191 [Marchantia polymorpha]BBN14417.1 hypothetical protein Mp_6g11510 [Marchantia polymorpha subsp. ruderalis]|eukprot:PTQ45151.1 hypothetical protein MARPO_0016s0191 [Marchantia polymorpha]